MPTSTYNTTFNANRRSNECSPGITASQISASGERTPIWLLVAAHVVLGLLFSFWSAVQGELPIVLDMLLLVPVFGLTFAQTSLLGFWAVFSPVAWWIRLAGLVGGVVYLEIIFAIGLASGDLSMLVTMTTGGIATVYGVVYWRYARLERFPQHVSLTAQDGLKFSIRGLMTFTFIVAVALVGIRTLRENPPTEQVFVLAVWSLCFAMVGVAGVWAGLGLARPMPRIAVLLLMSAVLGLLFMYCLNSDEWQSYFYSVSVMVLQAAVLIASLLIVRSCGYRLVRRPVTEMGSRIETEQMSLDQQLNPPLLTRSAESFFETGLIASPTYAGAMDGAKLEDGTVTYPGQKTLFD